MILNGELVRNWPERNLMKYIQRACENVILKQAKMFKVILITGARQVGKTTILKNLAPELPYVTLDNIAESQRAIEEPELFLRAHTPPVVIDEVQYAPELLRYIKIAVDNSDKKALFYLTGSQKFNLMKNVSESLAGRIGILNLLGLSLREVASEKFNEPFLPTEQFLKRRQKTVTEISYRELWKLIFKGAMPAMQERGADAEMYYASYVNTYIERDVRNLTQVGDVGDFLKFMTALAGRIGQLLNLTNLAREVGISANTAKRWLSILETSNIVYVLEPYHSNLLKRIVKTPKVYFYDTGLAAYLTRWKTPEALEAGLMAGNFFENFVIMEIVKSYYNAGVLRPPLSFYRDKEQNEIDLIIEENGKLYPIEIKKTARPMREMTDGFTMLRESGKLVGTGAIICAVDSPLFVSEDVMALPYYYI